MAQMLAGSAGTGLSQVQGLFTTLAHLLRCYQLYGPSGTPNARVLANVRAQFQQVWTFLSEVEVEVTDRALLLGDQVVHTAEAQSESLPFALYRDSIRRLTFLPGFETYEVESLAQVLYAARNQRSESDDLLTMLWERDFVYMRYAYVDVSEGSADDGRGDEGPGTGLAGGPPRDLGDGDLGNAPPEAGAVEGPAGETGAPVPAAWKDPEGLPDDPVAHFTRAALVLGESELEYLRVESDRESNRDVVRDVVFALLDILEEPIARLQSDALRCFEQMLPYLLERGNLPLATETMNELRTLAERPESEGALQAEMRRVVLDFARDAVQPDKRSLLDEHAATAPEVVSALLRHCGPDCFEALIPWMPVARAALREPLLELAAELLQSEPAALGRVLAAQDAAGLEAALAVAARAGNPILATPVIAVLRHEKPALRVAAVNTLTSLGGDTAIGALVAVLQDSVPEVRRAAAWGLGVWQHAPALAALEAIVRHRGFAQAPLAEKIAMFDAYARVGGEASVPALVQILWPGFRLGRRTSPETRACAARALGVIGTAPARAALEAARSARDPAVRTAVLRALERMK